MENRSAQKGGLEPPNTCGKAKEIPQGIGQDRARRGRFCPSEGHEALVGGLGHARQRAFVAEISSTPPRCASKSRRASWRSLPAAVRLSKRSSRALLAARVSVPMAPRTMRAASARESGGTLDWRVVSFSIRGSTWGGCGPQSRALPERSTRRDRRDHDCYQPEKHSVGATFSAAC